jgi:hypothetical protein
MIELDRCAASPDRSLLLGGGGGGEDVSGLLNTVQQELVRKKSEQKILWSTVLFICTYVYHCLC